ncbi:ssDNA-binding protein, partial [Pollutimonas sp. H1-120]|uniref:ssDNA-binding protein n=1 Tax=Pollutimonas sp. H1-120 TaxID=3148824 RepID=UPI003B52B568
YGRATVTFYAFNTNGNKGVACGLGNLQLIRDGEPLGGRASAADEFTAFSDDGPDDFLA